MTWDSKQLIGLRVRKDSLEDCIEDVHMNLFGTAYSRVHQIIERNDDCVTVVVEMDAPYPFIEGQWQTRWDERYEKNVYGPSVRIESA